MNRPEAKNAFSVPMLVGMVDAWAEIDSNDDIRCAILTGAGGRLLFRDGPEVDGRHRKPRSTSTAGRPDPDLHWKALLRHYQLRKPLIAAVEGWAVAGGTEILQATDIRVAGQTAKFGVFEARRGLFPLGGSTVRLRRQIPYTVAMDLLLTAREVSGRRGPADRADRPGRPRRRGPGRGVQDRRGHRRQRPPGGGGDPADRCARPRACRRSTA